MTMPQAPFVSVIIPVYNDAARLAQCLRALETQTYPRQAYEVIVVDNGSCESIEPVMAHFLQAKAMVEKLPGSYAARNTGIAHARGEVLAFTDADCLPTTDWVEQGVKKLYSLSSMGSIGGQVVVTFRDAAHPTAVELYEQIMYFNQQRFIEQQRFSLTANLFTFKAVVDQVGRFDHELKSSGDKEWGQRASALGYPVIYAADARVFHPARSTLAELRQKVIRLSDGFDDLDQKRRLRKRSAFLSEGVMDWIPPVRSVWQLKVSPPVPATEKLRILAIWGQMKIVECIERMNHRVLHKPSHR